MDQEDSIRRNIRVFLALRDRSFASLADQYQVSRPTVGNRYQVPGKFILWWAEALETSPTELVAEGEWVCR